MNLDMILKNPDLIDSLSPTEKTNIYFQINKVKTDLNNRLAEYKAKKELLEKQKLEIQDELLKEAGVDDISKIGPYLEKLQKDYDEALKKETENLNDLLNKMGLNI